jgi:UDP-N-acetylmuramyl tripeptide synthase
LERYFHEIASALPCPFSGAKEAAAALIYHENNVDLEQVFAFLRKFSPKYVLLGRQEFL